MAQIHILIEGPDGCGKTTVSGLLAKYLRTFGKAVSETNTPTDGPIGRLIREFLTKKHPLPEGKLNRQSLMGHLFLADMEDYYNMMTRWSRLGEYIIQSRGIISTMVYQPLMMEELRLRDVKEHHPKPDLTIFLDLDVDTCMKRVAGKVEDIYEKRDVLEAVCMAYRVAAAEERNPKIVIDARQSIDTVFEQVLAELGRRGFMKGITLK